MGDTFTRSFGMAGAFGEGIGFELGYAQDNYGDYGIYFRLSGEMGLGGGAGISMSTPLNSTDPRKHLKLEDIEGHDTQHNLELGPLTFSSGGNVRDPNLTRRGKGLSGFSNYGDDYMYGDASVGLINYKKFKLKAKLSAGYRVSMGKTWFLYKNKK